jgi:hypothetical protein
MEAAGNISFATRTVSAIKNCIKIYFQCNQTFMLATKYPIFSSVVQDLHVNLVCRAKKMLNLQLNKL